VNEARLSHQEEFWAGEFGDEYCRRNHGDARVAANVAFFSRALAKAAPVRTVLEAGANIGLNLRALKQLAPKAVLSAIEINHQAVDAMRASGCADEIFRQSLLTFEPGGRRWDLVFTKGVLIHLAPDQLSRAYRLLVEASARYLMIAEYYNPTPVEVSYRGHAERLFKRDFAGEILDRYPALTLVDYGFCWHRDPQHPQDDLTWFLFEKGPVPRWRSGRTPASAPAAGTSCVAWRWPASFAGAARPSPF
jgi:spore coat polysaccharide biosynthesis protein SpsF